MGSPQPALASLDAIVDQVQKQSEAQLSSTLAQLREKLREERNKLIDQLGVVSRQSPIHPSEC